jgi:hypothetical protein
MIVVIAIVVGVYVVCASIEAAIFSYFNRYSQPNREQAGVTEEANAEPADVAAR